jgi:hypothetical protein
MSFINKADYVLKALIAPDFFTRIVNALDGTTPTDISITGLLKIVKGKLQIDGTAVNAQASDLNALATASLTPGVNHLNAPLVAGATRNLDYLRVQSLSAGQIVLDVADVSGTAGKIFAYNNFN